jgi:hypothetical protein
MAIPKRRSRTCDYIYALVDPRTHNIHYVGKARNPEERLRWHLKDDRNCARVKWIEELRAEGFCPLIAVLEVVRSPQTWQEREIWWIAKGRELGWPLTNVSDGGDEPPKYNNRPQLQPKRNRSVQAGKRVK